MTNYYGKTLSSLGEIDTIRIIDHTTRTTPNWTHRDLWQIIEESKVQDYPKGSVPFWVPPVFTIEYSGGLRVQADRYNVMIFLPDDRKGSAFLESKPQRLPSSANADNFRDAATRARTEYAAAQVKWQTGLAALVAQSKPEFKEIATVQRDLQLSWIEQGTAQFRYLLDHDFHRIVLTNGVSQFLNFEWTDADTKALTKSNPTYDKLQKRIKVLEKKNDEQPDWPKFRVWFHDTLSKSKDYEALLSAFQAKDKEVEDLLQRYKPN